jgi:DNA-directed RNA polymerase specialized sigma24 family protein
MSSVAAVSEWLAQLKAGDPAAAQRLWADYFQRLVRVARQKLRNAPRRMADEEDVALSALNSFCQGARADRFPSLDDRNDLWALLLVITARKACNLVRLQRRDKRGGGKVRGDSALLAPGAAASGAGMDGVAGPEPTPAFAAQVSEQCRRLFSCLESPELESIARWKLEGYTNDEIADRLGRSRGTVERKLRLIRSIWAKAAEAAP